MKTKLLLTSLLFITFLGFINAQNDRSSTLNQIKNHVAVSGTWYLFHKTDITNNTNKFFLKRGYITFKSKLDKKLAIRYTQDITIDKEGADAGNVEFRMKYLYLKYKPFAKGVLKNSYAEFGLAHRPYVDFDQKINPYRSQDKMFIEKAGVINTADFGILYTGLFGDKLSKEQQAKSGNHHPGKYGSYAFGVFNGGGYHDFEANNNKTLEARLTYRPLADYIPGLQITYAGAVGRGNREDSDTFIMSLFALSLEKVNYTLSAQYYFGEGDYHGTYIDLQNNAVINEGYSLFGEYKIPNTAFALFGRYDNFSSAYSQNYYQGGYFCGVAYRFLKSKVFASYSKDSFVEKEKEAFNIVLEVTF